MDPKRTVKQDPSGKIRLSSLFSQFSFDSELVLAITSVVVLLVTIVFLFFKFRKSSQKIVLLSGLSSSGKTLLFARLVYSKYFQSCTSLKENVGSFTYDKKNIKVVDIPGDDRLRWKYFDQYKSSAKAIVYVLDSGSVQSSLRDIADSLYLILADNIVQKSRVQVLVCCNKQDVTLAKSCSVVKNLLQKELNVVRRTKSSQLEDTNESGTNLKFLGSPDRDFQFSDLQNPVSFCDTTGLNTDSSEYDVNELQEWIAAV